LTTGLANSWKIRVVMPALDEEAAIGSVIDAIPAHWVDSIHVGDNGSRDATAEVARKHGARVVHATRRGYGSACLAALADLDQLAQPNSDEIVVFLDADHSDDPAQIPALITPIIEDQADLVLGSRAHPGIEAGSLTPQQRWGNALATTLIRWIHGHRYQDLGPFRAIRLDLLQQLQMSDPDFGWTVEMQLKALRQGLRVLEVPLPYRRRIGESKISGTVLGSCKAGFKILQWIWLDAWRGDRPAVDTLASHTKERRPSDGGNLL
jgi:glycosyltransferase involved in cell wall biosynthesis